MPTFALDRLISLIRKNTDEPAVKAKFSDADLITRIEQSCRQIISDLNSVADNAMIVRHPISVANGSTLFLMPPNVEQVRKIAKINSELGSTDWELEPNSPLCTWGEGFRLEGRCLRFDPPWPGSDEDLVIWYVPNGDFRLHYGTAVRVSEDGTQVTLASTPTKGELDTRENCYAGAMIRIVGSQQGLVQERFATAYDRIGRLATLDVALDPIPEGTITYEILPIYQPHLEHVVAWQVAMEMKAIGRDTNAYYLLERQYTKAMRSLRLAVKRMNNILGTSYHRPGVGGMSFGAIAGVTI